MLVEGHCVKACIGKNGMVPCSPNQIPSALNQENPSRAFFVAKMVSPGPMWQGGHWSVIFNPTGAIMGRYSEAEAKRIASEKNALYSNDKARSHPFVGQLFVSFNADGSLYTANKIISVAKDPPGTIAGSVDALLDDGHMFGGAEEWMKGSLERGQQKLKGESVF
jgi:hypothetical protein